MNSTSKFIYSLIEQDNIDTFIISSLNSNINSIFIDIFYYLSSIISYSNTQGEIITKTIMTLDSNPNKNKIYKVLLFLSKVLIKHLSSKRNYSKIIYVINIKMLDAIYDIDIIVQRLNLLYVIAKIVNIIVEMILSNALLMFFLDNLKHIEYIIIINNSTSKASINKLFKSNIFDSIYALIEVRIEIVKNILVIIFLLFINFTCFHKFF